MHLRTSFISLNLIIHLQGVRAITPDMRLPLSPKEGPGTIMAFRLFSYSYLAMASVRPYYSRKLCSSGFDEQMIVWSIENGWAITSSIEKPTGRTFRDLQQASEKIESGMKPLSCPFCSRLSFYLSERIKPYEADITGLAIFSFALAFLFVYRIVYLLSGA